MEKMEIFIYFPWTFDTGLRQWIDNWAHRGHFSPRLAHMLPGCSVLTATSEHLKLIVWKKKPCHRHLPYPYMSPGRWLHCWSRHVSWALPGVTPSRRLTELRKSRFNSLLKALLAPRHKAGSRNPELVELLEDLVCYCLGAEQLW